jgi:hypothetical protein
MQNMQNATLQRINTTLLAAGWKLERYANEKDGNYDEEATWTGTHTLTTDGECMGWCTAGEQVQITSIGVFVQEDGYITVNIQHEYEENETDMLYADEGIQTDISKLMTVGVRFTEMGMQDEFYMSMEVWSDEYTDSGV